MNNKLKTRLEDMAAIAAYVETISETLKPSLALPSEGQYAVIADYAESWQSAVSALEQVSPPEMVDRAHQTLIAQTRLVAAAWQKLQDANGAQDSEAFNQAETELTTQYDEYRTATAAVTTLAISIQSSIDRYIEELSISDE